MIRASNNWSDAIVFKKKAVANLAGRYITPGITTNS